MIIEVEDEPDLTLPEDSIHVARLVELTPKEIKWTADGVEKTNQILEWWWEITSTNLGEQYIGRRIKGSCSAKATNREGNRFRQWAEVLLGREIPVGMKLDTEDLVGLEAEVVIGHRDDKKDPSRKWEFVSDLAPTNGSFTTEPPF
jgi:hypothetical protein